MISGCRVLWYGDVSTRKKWRTVQHITKRQFVRIQLPGRAKMKKYVCTLRCRDIERIWPGALPCAFYSDSEFIDYPKDPTLKVFKCEFGYGAIFAKEVDLWSPLSAKPISHLKEFKSFTHPWEKSVILSRTESQFHRWLCNCMSEDTSYKVNTENQFIGGWKHEFYGFTNDS